MTRDPLAEPGRSPSPATGTPTPRGTSPRPSTQTPRCPVSNLVPAIAAFGSLALVALIVWPFRSARASANLAHNNRSASVALNDGIWWTLTIRHGDNVRYRRFLREHTAMAAWTAEVDAATEWANSLDVPIGDQQ